ncbi:MAG: RrF2 family transcriptional regulator, partial [Acidimicrobiales bacterium]
VSTGFLQQILQALQRGGLVTSRPSRAGGYALTRRPVDISVLDVIETLEGPLDAGECAFRGEPCEWGEICAVHEVWSAGQAAFRASLRSVTVADMASVAELEVCDYES